MERGISGMFIQTYTLADAAATFICGLQNIADI
jgi:hypothetical protein